MNFEKESSLGLGYLNCIKYFHWTSKNFSEHLILDELYNNFQELIDKLSECLIGREDIKNEKSKKYGYVDLNKYKNSKELIKECLNYYDSLETDCREIAAIIDLIVEVFVKAKYKLNMI